MSSQEKTACVFGGAGFLGSHVADSLSKSGFRVKVFDLKRSEWLSSDQEMLVGDLLDFEAVQSAVDGCEVVYNLAAIADLDEAVDRPIDTIKINVLANGYVLEACRIAQVKRFVYASSVYVHSAEGGFYKASKKAAESYVEEYGKKYCLPYTILRYGSLYGPRSDYHNGIWRIVNRALETGDVSYEGSSEAMREYIHVRDAADASVAILDLDSASQHLVLTGQEPMRVTDMLNMLAEILGSKTQVEFIESEHPAHYVRTPYVYQPTLGKKYVLPLHVDLGQGLLELIHELTR